MSVIIHSHLQYATLSCHHFPKGRIPAALCDLKTILPILFPLAAPSEDKRRANTPVIKTQTRLSLSPLSSPSPATHQPQGLTTPYTGGDRISPRTSKHNMKIKRAQKHTDTALPIPPTLSSVVILTMLVRDCQGKEI